MSVCFVAPPPSWRGCEEAIWGIVRLIFTFSLFISLKYLFTCFLSKPQKNKKKDVFSHLLPHVCILTNSISWGKYPEKGYKWMPTIMVKTTHLIFVMPSHSVCTRFDKFVQKWVFDGLAWCWNFRSLDKWYIVVFLFCS